MSTASQNPFPWPKADAAPSQGSSAGPHRKNFDLSHLRSAIQELEGPTISQLESVSDEALQVALRAAEELFSGNPTIELVCDAEAPEYPYFGINVKWGGDARGMIAQEIAWSRRVGHLFGPFQRPRLCVVAG